MPKKIRETNKLRGKTVDAKLEELSGIVQDGFAQTAAGFAQTADGLAKTATKEEVKDKLDELATMVAQGFAETVSKTEFYEFKGETSKRFDRLEKWFTDLDSRIVQIEINLAKLTERVERFVAIVEAQQGELREMRETIRKLELRITRLESFNTQ